MIKDLPPGINILFCLALLIAMTFFYFATRRSLIVLWCCIVWLAIQGCLAWKGFYLSVNSIPPRLVLMAAPMMLLIVFLFITKAGREFIDGLDTRLLTLLHIVRIPVEIVLYWLMLKQFIPKVMTFEGRNFDIFSGVTAPFIYYFGSLSSC